MQQSFPANNYRPDSNFQNLEVSVRFLSTSSSIVQICTINPQEYIKGNSYSHTARLIRPDID